MEKTSINTIAGWVSGRLNIAGDIYIKKAVIDSRDAEEETLFFCLKGTKSDGHEYQEEVRSKGGCTIGERDDCDIVVKSSLEALSDIAREYRKTLDCIVVGITGSNGKTTTTRLIRSVLGKAYKVHSSQKNFNNHIGLPLALLGIDKSTEIAVLEMGANHTGEIASLSDIAGPCIGILTNIGDAHIGYFGGPRKILDAKFELARSLPEGGTLIYNFDQPEIRDEAIKYGVKLNLLGFGKDPAADMTFQILQFDHESTIFEVEGYTFKLNMPCIFNVYNALAAVATAKIFDISFEDVDSAFREMCALSHRLETIEINGIKIIDDSYNSSPASLKTLFSELLKIYPQKDIIAVIGEMLELGEYSAKFHREAGRYIAGLDNVKCLIAGGSYAEKLIEGAIEGGLDGENTHLFSTSSEAAGLIRRKADNNSLVVIKASRRQKLEKIIEDLKE
ncbi:MAG: UDP-N-acetylmuramoyl-tripeptide--D-alanyl-D-alanine ligase [Elusimicrobiota bacterium]